MMETVKEKHRPVKRKTASKPATVVAFEQWEARQSGDFNYEFYYGEVVKKPAIKQSEMIIVNFLTNCFLFTVAKKQGGGLFAEVDVYIDEQRKRIADLAFFNSQQIISTAKGEKEVPAFAIELLSKSESFENIEKKLQDYFDAGVQLVWYISPKAKRIYAYTPQNQVQVYVTGAIATADPVLPDFKIDIDKLFTVA